VYIKVSIKCSKLRIYFLT